MRAFNAVASKLNNLRLLLIASLVSLFAAARFAQNEAAQIEAGVIAIVGIVVAVLVFAAVAPEIATGLNDTKAAFTGFAGVSGLVNILPLILVVAVLLFLFLRGS